MRKLFLTTAAEVAPDNNEAEISMESASGGDHSINFSVQAVSIIKKNI